MCINLWAMYLILNNAQSSSWDVWWARSFLSGPLFSVWLEYRAVQFGCSCQRQFVCCYFVTVFCGSQGLRDLSWVVCELPSSPSLVGRHRRGPDSYGGVSAQRKNVWGSQSKTGHRLRYRYLVWHSHSGLPVIPPAPPPPPRHHHSTMRGREFCHWSELVLSCPRCGKSCGWSWSYWPPRWTNLE